MGADPRHVRGAAAEAAARRLLESAGLACLATNARTRAGEWDLVMRDGELLVFVEVRLRAHAGYGGALASVDHRKQRKLMAAAGLWLQRHPALARLRQRYDVVAFSALDQPPQWVRDAWRPG